MRFADEWPLLDIKRAANRITDDEWAAESGQTVEAISRFRRGLSLPGSNAWAALKLALARLIERRKERMCRATLEPHGLTVKRFWIDEAGIGHAETVDAKGRVFLFNEKAK